MAYGNLQIEEDMSFQEKTWKVERVGWVLMVLIVLASLLGVIDKGWLSSTRVGDPAKLQIEFDRFIHIDTPAELRLKVATDGPFTIGLPYQYLKEVEVSNIIPHPASVESQDGIVRYSFAAGRGIADVLLDIKPRQPGTLKGFLQSGTERLDFTQYVYP